MSACWFSLAPIRSPSPPAIISHVPGGLGVFESLIVLGLPEHSGRSAARLAACLACGLLPAAAAGGRGAVRRPGTARRSARRLARIEQLAAAYIAPIVPQVSGALVFVAGFSLLVSGVTPSIDQRLSVLRDVLPLVVLEFSHLAGSVIGLALLILARALFRRLAAAYQLTVWLLVAGMMTSLLRGLEIRAGAHPRSGAGDPVARAARVLSAGRNPGAAIHADVDRESRDRDLDRGVDRLLCLPARRLFALAVVDVRVRSRCAAHAARLAAGGAARRGLPGR